MALSKKREEYHIYISLALAGFVKHKFGLAYLIPLLQSQNYIPKLIPIATTAFP
jgi:hypothetical protein